MCLGVAPTVFWPESGSFKAEQTFPADIARLDSKNATGRQVLAYDGKESTASLAVHNKSFANGTEDFVGID